MKVLSMVAIMIAFGSPAFAATSEQVSKEAGEAVDAATAYANESKDEFAREMRANLADVEADISDLKNRAGAAAEDARGRIDERIAELEKKRDAMKKRLDKLSNSSDRAWKRMKSGLERAWSEVKVAYKKASSEFEAEEASKE